MFYITVKDLRNMLDGKPDDMKIEIAEFDGYGDPVESTRKPMQNSWLEAWNNTFIIG